MEVKMARCLTSNHNVLMYRHLQSFNATPAGNSTIFFDSFNTPQIARAETDDNGFFQVNIPNGPYTIAIVENGKLYANGTDGQDGLSPFQVLNGTEKVNVTMTYKATF